ncbi:MAG: tRNA (guanosine(18)-2'-O)-methyltransferase TrmH [Gemmatimonadetes bacterium]|nr:tRNA (guanosine(18)-2'-O)-methyltransferase TrmH [Gemmatimonadota bacterium]
MQPARFHRLKSVLARRQPDLTVLVDQVNKGRNFSAVLRSCDAVGVLEAHAVSPDGGLDVHHATSGGTKKWVTVREHENVASAIGHLKSRDFSVLAAHVDREARDYRDVDFTVPTAIVLGAELAGVSAETLRFADGLVSIPMMGMVDSLNVSVAAALLLYEARRQREAAGMYDEPRISTTEEHRILFEWAYPRVAAIYRREGRSYPPLGPDGEILEADQ